MIQKTPPSDFNSKLKTIWEKLGLIDHLELTFDIEQIEFVKQLKAHVDESNLSLWSDMGDPFSRSKNEFKGIVDQNGFKIKRKKKFFDVNFNLATAEGRFHQERDQLRIDIELNGVAKRLKIFFVFVVLFYAIFFVTIFGLGQSGEVPLFVLPFMLIHAAFMIGIPYFILRRSVKRMKYELERELFFIANK
ncbi:MAG: hypothetical protein AAF741_13710 [Bacteroidota bacterium]